MAYSTSNLSRPDPQSLSGAIESLAARFGNRLVTSQAVREQHGHTTTWVPNQPPDAVIFAQDTADIQDVVRICAPRGVPVTLKMRTGWCDTERNVVRLARGAESAGVAMVTVHGRTREQGYRGEAEYDTIAAVKAALRIPVVANGDIDSPRKAAAVLKATGADALMIGRAAQGRPWIFREIAHYLATGELAPPPPTRDVARWLTEHLLDHYGLYGEELGVRTARKHIGWAVHGLPGGPEFRAVMNTHGDCATQIAGVTDYFEQLADRHALWPAANDSRLRQEA